MHLDLRVPNMEAEVARLGLAGGAMPHAKPFEEDGWAWHVLVDLDGNEFCVLRPSATSTNIDSSTSPRR